jgi:DNA helicase-2/ATP-dependent DNA helicase PcrA
VRKTSSDLIVPQRFYAAQQAKLGDRHGYASRSRFIPDAILGLFDQVGWHDRQASARPAKVRGPTTDVAAGLPRHWR